jgi:hypothetical protein
MNAYAKWFRRIVGLGVLLNFVLSLPTLFTPERMIALFNLEPAIPLVWVRFSANLLILLSLFYIPAAIDPYRYQASAWLAVIARLVGFTFFLTQPRDYLIFGLFDLAFAIPEAILLILLTLRSKSIAGSASLQEGGV